MTKENLSEEEIKEKYLKKYRKQLRKEGINDKDFINWCDKFDLYEKAYKQGYQKSEEEYEKYLEDYKKEQREILNQEVLKLLEPLEDYMKKHKFSGGLMIFEMALRSLKEPKKEDKK